MTSFLNLNKYRWDLVYHNGRKATDHGQWLDTYYPDMISAYNRVLYLKKRHGWKGVKPKLIEVWLNQTAFAHVGYKPGQDRNPSVWLNHGGEDGLSLRIF